MSELAKAKQFVCSSCGAHSPDWDMCAAKGLGAWRGHDWTPIPDCMACDDTGYEPGMPGYYCTFCKAGHKVAYAQVKAGIDPWNVDGQFDESDADKRRYADWPCEAADGNSADEGK